MDRDWWPGPTGPWGRELRGRLDLLSIESEVLKDNPLGDPHVRPVWVYTPPGYDESKRYPTVFQIQGFTGQLDMWASRPAMRPTTIERFDAMYDEEDAPPCVIAFVDCWTSLGGSQFVDSPGTGQYHTYLCEEVVPFVDAYYATAPDAAHRGIAGKSSGGYGAMITPMLRPDVFGGLATHAGDALFEVSMAKDFGLCARALRDHYDGSWDRFLEDFRSRPAMSKEHDDTLLITYAMGACWSAEADGTVTMPFDPLTGEVDFAVLQRWLDWDPVRMVPRYADALRGLKAIYIDAGTRDQWYLDLGAEAFRRALADIGVTDVFFELFDATHTAIEYRYPIALRYLAERLAP